MRLISYKLFEKEWYEILDLTKEESKDPDKVKSAYRKKSMEFHPDRNSGLDAEEMMKKINRAYHDRYSDDGMENPDFGHRGNPSEEEFGFYKNYMKKLKMQEKILTISVFSFIGILSFVKYKMDQKSMKKGYEESFRKILSINFTDKEIREIQLILKKDKELNDLLNKLETCSYKDSIVITTKINNRFDQILPAQHKSKFKDSLSKYTIKNGDIYKRNLNKYIGK